MDSVAKQNRIEIQKKFVEKCKKEVFPFLRAHEVLRKKIRKKTILFFGIPFLVTLFATLILFVCAFQEPNCFLLFFFLLMALAVEAMVFLNLYNKKKKNFALELKNHCLQKLLNCFGEINWKNNACLIDTKDLNRSELFPTVDDRINDDEFSGTYKNVSFKVCETVLLHEVSSGRNRTITKVFSGIVFKFRLNKSVKAHTIVSTKGDLTARDNWWLWLLGSLGFIEPIVKSCEDGNYIFAIILFVLYIVIGIVVVLFKIFCKFDDGKQKIILEDVKFGKKYHVYSQDQVEARCIVTPKFMEKFLNLSTAYGSKNAKCAFYGNNVMFAITTDKNLFEIGDIDKTLLESETFKTLYNEINAIYEIIDYFNLDR